MPDQMPNERLAEILWTARKRALGDGDDGHTFATQSPRIRKQYERFAAEVAKRLDQGHDAKYWHDTYQQAANAFDGFLTELLELLPCEHTEMLDPYAEIPNDLEKVITDRDRLAEQVKRVRDRHKPITVQVADDLTGETTNITVCLECDGIRETSSDEADPILHPCPTIRALDDQDGDDR